MKYLILFSGENKKSITNLSSAKLAWRVVKVNQYFASTECIVVENTTLSSQMREVVHVIFFLICP